MTTNNDPPKTPILLGMFALLAMLAVGAYLFLYVTTGPVPTATMERSLTAGQEPADTSPAGDAAETDTPRQPATHEPDDAAADAPAELEPASPPPQADPRRREPPPALPPAEFRPRRSTEAELPDGSIDRTELPPDLRAEANKVHRDLEVTLRMLEDLMR
jgi:hypothetical protein